LRPCSQREGDLQKPLLAVWELPSRSVEVGFEAEARKQAFDFSDISGRPPATRQKSAPEPLRSEIASASDSAGVKSGKSWLIWNVRDRPILTRALGARCVTSRPRSKTWPTVGLRTPVRRLISVVLPAPFGPMSACLAPG
jgi:hypothetical protein